MMLNHRSRQAKGHVEAGGNFVTVACRFAPEVFAQINARAGAGKLSTAEIVRRLVDKGLAPEGAARAPEEKP